MVKKFPKSFVHSENLIDLYPDLFYRNLSSLNYNAPNDNLKNPKDVPPPIYMQNDKILKIEYKINSDFYRSENFIDPADILILGCSQTYGYGMIDLDFNFVEHRFGANEELTIGGIDTPNDGRCAVNLNTHGARIHEPIQNRKITRQDGIFGVFEVCVFHAVSMARNQRDHKGSCATSQSDPFSSRMPQ